MSGISPEIDEQKPCAHLHRRSGPSHELQVVCRRQDMDSVRYEQDVMVAGKRCFEDVAFHDIDPRSLRLRGQSLPRDRAGSW